MRNISAKTDLSNSHYNKKLHQLKKKYTLAVQIMIAKQSSSQSEECKQMKLVLSLLLTPPDRHKFPKVVSVLRAVEGKIKAWKLDFDL
mmetsp:Transcript_123034/g.184035  ORF Transcript_123034/g.184035 Transcript_123034/m.184035 type:complete len:88 (-) Transcript_123034:74-337(-)